MKAVIFSRTRSTPSLGLMAIRDREIQFQVRFRGSSLDPHVHTQTHAHCGKRLRSRLQNNPFPRSPSSAPHPAGTAPLICAEPMVGTPALIDTRIRRVRASLARVPSQLPSAEGAERPPPLRLTDAQRPKSISGARGSRRTAPRGRRGLDFRAAALT